MITKSQARRIADINKLFEKLGSNYELVFEDWKKPMEARAFIKVRTNTHKGSIVSSADTHKELNQFLTGIETALTCITEYAMTHKENADNGNPISIRNENIAWGEVTANVVGGCVTMVPISEIFKADATDFSAIEPGEEEKL